MKKTFIILVILCFGYAICMKSEKPSFKAIHKVLKVATQPVSGVCHVGDGVVPFSHHSFDRNPSKPILRGLQAAFKSEACI